MPRRPLDTASIRLVTIRAGNLSNSHIYLREIMDFFPVSSVGASNRAGGTGTMLKLHLCCRENPVETDIAGDKKIFRKRFWRDFFDHHRLEVGDRIALERLSEFEYRVYPWVDRDAGR